jgi:hypothetical protein
MLLQISSFMTVILTNNLLDASDRLPMPLPRRKMHQNSVQVEAEPGSKFCFDVLPPRTMSASPENALGRQNTNLPGRRLEKVRYTPMATELLRCRE